jgi:hypothetical protein
MGTREQAEGWHRALAEVGARLAMALARGHGMARRDLTDGASTLERVAREMREIAER